MFAASFYIFDKIFKLDRNKSILYSIIAGVSIYTSIYLYGVVSSESILMLFKNISPYVISCDLAIACFYYYNTRRVVQKDDFNVYTIPNSYITEESDSEGESEEDSEGETEEESEEESEEDAKEESEEDAEEESEEDAEGDDAEGDDIEEISTLAKYTDTDTNTHTDDDVKLLNKIFDADTTSNVYEIKEEDLVEFQLSDLI